MKKLFYLTLLAIGGFTIASCDKEAASNPGDFSLKSTLEVEPQIVSTGGFTAELKLLRSIDSTYQYSSIKNDTVKDAEGNPVIGSDGKLQIKADTTWYDGNTTARFSEYEVVALPASADTFTIRLKSNAQWKAPVPSPGTKAQWYFNYNLLTGTTSTSGGGDGYVYFRTLRNRNKKRSVTAVQDIMTNDSTVLVRLRFDQSGERD